MNFALVVWGVIIIAVGSLMTGIGWNWDKFRKQNKTTPGINATISGNYNIVAGRDVTIQKTVEPSQIDRPCIVVIHVTSPDDIRVGIPLKAIITFQNTGRSPATNVRSAAIAEWLLPGKTPGFSYNDVKIIGNATVGVGGKFLAELHPTKDPKGEIGYLVQKDFEAIIAKSLVLFVHGRISYDDIFGKSHWTNYCYWLSMLRTGEYYWNVYSEHNEIDKN